MTKLAFNRQELLNALTIVSGAVKSNDPNMIRTHLLFDVQDNVMTVIGSGDDLQLSIKLQVQSPNVSFTAPAKKFVDVLRASAIDEVKLTVEDAQVKIQLGRGRFTLVSLDPKTYPSMNITKKGQTFTMKPELLYSLIQSVGFSMAKNDARYFLNGMKFEFANNLVRAVATDGHRLAFNEVDFTDEDCPAVENEMNFIMPVGNVEKLANLLKKEKMTVNLSLLSNALYVDLGDVAMVAKLIDGRFPDYRRVMPKVKHHTVEMDKAELKGVFNRAKVMNNEPLYSLRFEFKGEEVDISTNNKTAENSKEIIAFKRIEGEGDVSIGLNGHYLTEAITQIANEKVQINLTDSISPVTIENGSAIYVIMPIRL